MFEWRSTRWSWPSLRLYLVSLVLVGLFLSVSFISRSFDSTSTPYSLPLDYLPIKKPSIDHLIIVPGHIVFKGSDFKDYLNEESWYLESFQQNQLPVFMKHIQQALSLLSTDPHSLLLFSGGQTRPQHPLSEALSYYYTAAHQQWFGINVDSSRISTEEFAKDSYENLLFSICRFKEITQHYPHRITIVGFEFKRNRFTDLHRMAIRFPIDRFQYIGINPEQGLEEAIDGENTYSFAPFHKDVYGCHDTLLAKRWKRNPWMQRHAYRVSCPELEPLLNYCPLIRDAVFPSSLPWSV